MFSAMLQALEKRVAKRSDLIYWLEENEPFLMQMIEEGQNRVEAADKADMEIEPFGHVIREFYWDRWKEAIKRYDVSRQGEHENKPENKRSNHGWSSPGL
jgi:hypothetical protein